MWRGNVTHGRHRSIYPCVTGKDCVVSAHSSYGRCRSFLVLTVIANVIRDTIYIDGGQLWLQQYEAFQRQVWFTLTIPEAFRTVASIMSMMVRAGLAELEGIYRVN
jgi:hypothetical protein